jgi:hypothetical protein
MKNIFLFLLLISCAAPNSNFNTDNKTLDFDKDLTIIQFNELLIEYSKISSYPSID